MRSRARLLTWLLPRVVVAGFTAFATLAIAQRGKPVARPPVKPPAAKVDAAVEDTPADASSRASSDAGASKPSAVATAPGPVEPPPAQEGGDGGVRPSPLNPTAQELPGSGGGVDAGTPIDYDRLLADIAALRARVAAVSDNLYQSRIAVAVQTDGDHGKIARLAVSVDDGVVFTAPAAFAPSDMTIVYDHAVAPGRHAVTIDVDRRDERDESFRTSQRNRFTVDVPRDNRVEVDVKVIDDSSMAKDFPSDKRGTYDLRLKVKATAKPVGK